MTNWGGTQLNVDSGSPPVADKGIRHPADATVL